MQYGKWIQLHKQAMRRAYLGVRQAPYASLLHACSLTFMIFIPLMLVLALGAMQKISSHWQHDVSISLYVNNLSIADSNQLLTKVRAIKGVASARYISADEGLKELQQSLGIEHLSKVMPTNPLPGVIQVYPVAHMKTVKHMQQLSRSFTDIAGINDIQLDTAWVQRVNAVLMLARRVGSSLVILLLLGILGVSTSQIRISLIKSINELKVLHLIGAGHQFIRRPLLYRSAGYAAVASLVACVLAVISVKWLEVPIGRLMQTYHQSIYNPMNIHFADMLLLVLGITLGAVIATFITSTYHLHKYLVHD